MASQSADLEALVAQAAVILDEAAKPFGELMKKLMKTPPPGSAAGPKE